MEGVPAKRFFLYDYYAVNSAWREWIILKQYGENFSTYDEDQKQENLGSISG